MPSSGSGALTFAPPALTLGSSLPQVPYYTLSPGPLHLLFSLLGVPFPSLPEGSVFHLLSNITLLRPAPTTL